MLENFIFILLQCEFFPGDIYQLITPPCQLNDMIMAAAIATNPDICIMTSN